MEQLNIYIQHARQQGQTDEQIRQALVAAGWNSAQVSNALGDVSSPAPANLAAPPDFNQPSAVVSPVISGGDQAFVAASSQNSPSKKKSKLPLLLVGVVVLVVVVGVAVFALAGSKTSYLTVIQNFITAEQNKDKAKVDSFESPAAKTYFQKNAGTSSFYDACKQAGDLCTASFKASYLSKATKTYKSYTASNGTKGKEVVYAVKQSAGGQGCNSNSTSTLTIAVVPKGKSWLVDYVNEAINFDGNVCPFSGGTTSVGN